MADQNAASAAQAVPSNLQGAKILDVSKITQDTSNPCVLETDDIASTLAAPVGIDRPGAGQAQDVGLEAGTNYLFNFSEADVASIVETCGDLVMTFEDGGTLTLTNFSQSTSADIPSVLAFAGELAGTEGAVEEAGDGEIVNITDIIDTAPEEAALEEPQTDVRETQQVAEAQTEQQTTQQTVDAQQFANIEPAAGDEPTAQDLAEIEPAAGDDAGSTGNTGFGFGSSFDPTGVIPLDDVGPIDPTALQYGITLPETDLLFEEEENGERPDDNPVILSPRALSLDESFLGPISLTDTLDVDFGNDGPGPNGVIPDGTSSVSGSSAGGSDLLSGGQVVDIQPTADGYVGTINGGTDEVFTLVIDPQTGEYTFTQLLPIDHADGNDPDDVITLNFGVEASDSDGDTASAEIVINIADDAPIANDDVNGAEEGQVITGNLVVNDEFSEDNPNTVTAIEFNGVTEPVPAGGSATVTTPLGTLTVNSDGTYTFETVDSGDPDGTATFTYTLTDGDGDSDTAKLDIRVTPDGAPVAVSGENLVDETNLTPGPLTTTGTATVDFGLDGPGTITPNGDFTASESVANGVLTSGGVPVDVNPTANGYVGVLQGTTTQVFELIITDPTTGEYSFELFTILDHADSTDPDDEIRLTFGVTATDSDGDSVDGNISILVKDDAPVALDDTNSAVESQTVTGNVMNNDEASEDEPTTVIQISFNGNTVDVLPGGTVIAGDYGVLTIQQDGSYSYTANSDNPDGVDVFGYVVEDFDGDRETADLTIDVAPIDDRPDVDTGFEVVDETDLDGGDIIVSGSLTADYGTDGPGTITPVDNFDSSGSRLNDTLTSNGFPVDVELVGTTYTGTANGETIFTMDVQPDGSYTFTLIGTLDHADPNDPNDIINLEFPVNATDADGDVTPTTITVAVLDDVPTIGDSQGDVDETNLDGGPLVFSNTLFTSFGTEVGSIAPNGDTETTADGNPITLTSNGDDVTITQVPGGYEGTTNGGTTTVFTLTIDPQTGKYVYTQFETLDHPDGTDPNDTIEISFDVDVTNTEGDTETGTITISVADDGVDAVDDVNGAEEGQDITGSVTANDDFSQDNPNTVTNVQFNGTNYPVSEGNPAVIATSLGTLTLNSDGSYTFEAADLGDPDGTAVFTYTLTDGDNDSDTATLSIRVSPDGEPIAVTEENTVDETNLTPGPAVVSDSIPVDFGIDGAGTISPNGTVTVSGSSAGGSTLTSGGQNVVIQPIGNGYVGVIDGTATTVFTLNVQDNGDYTFELLQPVDHADGTDPNDLIKLEFGITIQDDDGDTADGTITINVLDDAPVALDDAVMFDQDDNSVSGNVTDNDEFSEDVGNAVTQVAFGTNTVDVPETGTTTINGDFGVLEIAADGSYTYTLFDNTGGNGGSSALNPSASDFDGTQSSVTLNGITVTSQNGPDLVFVTDPVLGDGIGIFDGGGSNNIFGNDEILNVSFDPATEVTFTISDIGSNNVDDGLDYIVRLSDGTTVQQEFDINTVTPVDGVISFTLNAADFGSDVTITQVDLFSVVNSDLGRTSFRLQNVEVEYPGDNPECTHDQFVYTLTDFDGDQDTAVLDIKGKDEDEPILATIKPLSVDETDVVDTDSDTVTADFGSDGPGTYAVTGVGSFSFTGATNNTLTSNGVPVLLAVVGNSYVGTANGAEIFRLDLNQTTGQYEFTLTGALDHADPTNPDDVIELFFGVTAEDTDGDTDTGTIKVNVKDDGPSIDTRFKPVDESDLDNGPITLTRTLNHDYGTDGAGSIDPTGTFTAKFEVGGPDVTLTSGGVDIDVSSDADGYTGTADGEVIFTLTVEDDGEYTYTQFKAIDHPDGNDPDDVIWLKFEVEITDADGDTDTAIIGIDVHDDAPVAKDDDGHFDICDDKGFVEGDVIANDHVGADVPGSVTQVKFGNHFVDVDPHTGATIDGDFGQLKINADGTYSYELFDKPGTPETVYKFSVDHPNQNAAAGEIQDLDISYNETSHEFSFSMRIDDMADGFTVAINDGGNPKGHEAEMAIFYFDGSGNTPVVTAYSYNGQNAQNSWFDGSGANGVQAADPILSSIVDADLFSQLSVTTDGQGNKVMSFTIDASVIQSHDPAYGPQGEWSGVSFADKVGIWLHPVKGLHTDYDHDGYLSEWNFAKQGWYDVAYEHTTKHETDPCVCTKVFDAAQVDVSGHQSTVTADGITVTSVNGGDLVFTDFGILGSGIGIQSGGGSEKVFGDNEILAVSFDPADSVSFDIAEIGSNNLDDGIDLVVYLENGDQVTQEFDIGSTTPVNGTITIDLDASDFNGQLIERVDLSSVKDSNLGRASFVLSSVEVECRDHKEPTEDVFHYVLTDADGDSDLASLTIKGTVDDYSDLKIANDNNVLYGTDDADIFAFTEIDHDVDVIKGFDLTDGDVIDITQLIGKSNATQDAIDNFVFASNVGGDTKISVDVNGSGIEANAHAVAIVEGINNLDLDQALKTSDGLV